ncbi:MAG: Rrf2 family transcriptional regulator [Chitinophagaceae bacterium]|nr:Rrf2 family transcriptional regulator [Rubrivivax sp.]
MTKDSRLSGVLHVLLHMAELAGPSTSETLARAMRTNPVVVRRLMSGLRDAGLVESAKGHGGGWVLRLPLEEVSLADIHEALGSRDFFAMGHRDEHPACLVEQSVNAALSAVYLEAEALLMNRLKTVTLAALSSDFHRRMAAGKHSRQVIDHEA